MKNTLCYGEQNKKLNSSSPIAQSQQYIKINTKEAVKTVEGNFFMKRLRNL